MGGLEKYPKANSRDQNQYCDSSGPSVEEEAMSAPIRMAVRMMAIVQKDDKSPGVNGLVEGDIRFDAAPPFGTHNLLEHYRRYWSS